MRGCPSATRHGVVDDFEITGLGLNFDRRRIARAGRRSDGERHAVVIDRQGADLRAVIELRVFPLPARTEQVAREEAVVADQIARDGFDPGGLDLIGQSLNAGDRVRGFEFVIAIRIVGVESWREVRIAATVQNQVALQDAVFAGGTGRVDRGFDLEIGAEGVQRRRRGVELHVRRRHERFVHVPLEDDPALSRDDPRAPSRRSEFRLIQQRRDPRLQLGQRRRPVGRRRRLLRERRNERQRYDEQ